MSRHGEHLRDVKPYLAPDSRARGAFIYVVGEWVDSRGRVVGYQTIPSTQHRGVMDVRPLPPLPEFEPVEPR